MARIAGVNIPTNKRVLIALQYIHGIGPKFAKEITEKVGIPEARRGRVHGLPQPCQLLTRASRQTSHRHQCLFQAPKFHSK